MAEGGRVLVEGDDGITGLVVSEHLEKHGQKTVHGVGAHPVRIHGRQGVEGTVHQTVAVNGQKQIPHGKITSFPL